MINKSGLNIISLNQLESTKTLPGTERREKEFLAKTGVVSDTNFKSDHIRPLRLTIQSYAKIWPHFLGVISRKPYVP